VASACWHALLRIGLNEQNQIGAGPDRLGIRQVAAGLHLLASNNNAIFRVPNAIAVLSQYGTTLGPQPQPRLQAHNQTGDFL
jgi:hypothetical protein